MQQRLMALRRPSSGRPHGLGLAVSVAMVAAALFAGVGSNGSASALPLFASAQHVTVPAAATPTPKEAEWGPHHGPVCDRGDSDVAYNAMPFGVVNCLPPSEGFECCQMNEFGDQVDLKGNATLPGRNLKELKVVFGSWACLKGHWYDQQCQSPEGSTFDWPIRANIYDFAHPTSAPIATVTRTMRIPYRPSANPTKCTGPNAGKWFNPDAPNGGACQNSILAVLTFTDFVPSNVGLPEKVIWTVAFNTSTVGYNPIGPAACSTDSGGCPYDSLNVGAKSYPGAPYAGTDPHEKEAWASTTTKPELHVVYPGSLQWPDGGRPLGEIITSPFGWVGGPTSTQDSRT